MVGSTMAGIAAVENARETRGRLAAGRVLLLVAVAAFAGMRLWGMKGAWCFDNDEVFTIRLARLDWGGLFRGVIADISHPPLFYMLLKGWMGIGGQSYAWLKLLPFLIAMASVAPTWLLCRELGLRAHEAAVVILLLAFNGLLFYQAQHLRMFILFQFFAAWCAWSVARLVTRGAVTRWDWGVLFMAHLGMAYSHYWAWLVMGAELLALAALRPRRLAGFVAAAAGVAVCFAPWAILVARYAMQKGTAVEQVSWIARPTFTELAWFLGELNGTFPVKGLTPIGFAVFGVPVAWFLVRALRTRRRGEEGRQEWRLAVLTVLLVCVPVGLTFVASCVLKQSVWATRQLIVVVLPYAILAAVAAGRIEWPALRVVAMAAMVGWAGAAGVALKKGTPVKIRWDMLVGRIAEVEQGRSAVAYTTERFLARPLEFHANDRSGAWLTVRVSPGLAGLQGEHFWVVVRGTRTISSSEWRSRIEVMGYRVQREHSARTSTGHVRAMECVRAPTAGG